MRELIQNAYDGSGDYPTAEILIKLDLRAGEHGVLDVAKQRRRIPGWVGSEVDESCEHTTHADLGV